MSLRLYGALGVTRGRGRSSAACESRLLRPAAVEAIQPAAALLARVDALLRIGRARAVLLDDTTRHENTAPLLFTRAVASEARASGP